jgi:D-sedoheptulose 7-phosphate isomerase
MTSSTTDTGIAARRIAGHREIAALMDAMIPDIERAGHIIAEAIGSGNTILLCGNGGSAADAQHIAGELVGRFLSERRPLPSLALHANTTVLTAIANDYGFEAVYERQVRAHARPGDVLIAISTSGNSPNVLRAAEAARQLGLTVIGMTGRGGALAGLCDMCLAVPCDHTPHIQEMHILIGHILCEIAEAEEQP